MYFNPRSPYGERPGRNNGVFFPERFQSTLPVRGATPSHRAQPSGISISIHAPRTGSDKRRGRYEPPVKYFNPRSPYGERLLYFLLNIATFKFQSTLPVRGATRISKRANFFIYISIHAPRTGSDTPPSAPPSRTWYFNPRSPYGERQQKQPKSNAIFAPVKQFP